LTSVYSCVKNGLAWKQQNKFVREWITGDKL
jgi:hypothetical protein